MSRMTGIIGGWTTHPVLEIGSILMINHWLHMKVIQSCVHSYAVTSPQHIGKIPFLSSSSDDFVSFKSFHSWT